MIRIFYILLIKLIDFYFSINTPFKETRFKRWLLNKMGMKIGYPVIIDRYCEFWAPNTISIGSNVLIRNNCSIDHHVTIHDYCTIAKNVHILTSSHDPVTMVYIYKPVIIGKYSWIGAGTTILPGVEIGEFVTIGACSVVTKSIPSHSIAVGNPAKIIKTKLKPTNLYTNFGELKF